MDSLTGVGGVGISDGSCEVDRFEGVGTIVEFDELSNVAGVGQGEGFVVSVVAAVETGACIEEGKEGGGVVGSGFSKGESNGGEDVGDGDRDRAKFGLGESREAVSNTDEEVGALWGWRG